MNLDTALKRRLIAAAAAAVIDHAEELTELDRAIGDGDHGLNMKRGFEAVLADADNLAGKPLAEMLKGAGTHLVMTIGGASGPLYGSLLLAMGKAGGEGPIDVAAAARLLAEGVEAVKKRGKSDAGEKTMLEVLLPVSRRLSAAAGGEASADLAAELGAIADEGLESTRAMRATKGRASFLGERSIGHLDPGARSSQLLIRAVCTALAAARRSEEVGAA
ncbi:MAG TPA: dihydroxyacetone kinase subunit DhaL [Dongiaceae bacterium]|nr:dihydroxyacetone kinase subunit DhaL [Dongiaceae bacterium]